MNFRSRVRFRRYAPQAVLEITGEDAFSFLQGQCTQELKGCEAESRVVYSLWLNQKGKVLADSFVLRLPTGKWLVVSILSSASALRERLEAYIIADDVAVEDVTARWRALTVLGEGAGELLHAAGAVLPDADRFGMLDGGLCFRGRRDASVSWEWLYPADTDAGSVLGAAASLGAEEISEAELERLRIEAGIPAVPQDIGAEDLPNEAGLDHVAISYTKGCYLGQEVMARLKSMGQVRRRLMRVKGTGPLPSALPAALYAGDKKVGELRSVASTDTGFVGLALISLLALRGVDVLSLATDAPAAVVLTEPPP